MKEQNYQCKFFRLFILERVSYFSKFTKYLLPIIINSYFDFIKTMNKSLKKRSHVKNAALLQFVNDIRVNCTTLVLVLF